MHDAVKKHATLNARVLSWDASHRFAHSRSPTACTCACSRRSCNATPPSLLLHSCRKAVQHVVNFKLLRECTAGAPEGWRVTPRKVDVPREKPWLWRRTAMISSSSVMLSRQAVRSAYLHAPKPAARFITSSFVKKDT